MSVPDTTTCPICYCMIDMEFMVKHIEYHQESGDIGSSEPEYDPYLDEVFTEGNVVRVDL